MIESRIDATDRLRREGRWWIASLRKDERCRQLRSEGRTRKEASEMAWEWVSENYPPLTREQLAWRPAAETLAMAQFPPRVECVDAEGEQPLSAFWWVTLHARAVCECDGSRPQDRSRVLYHLGAHAPSPAAFELARCLLSEPSRFFELARAKFSAALSRIQEQAGLHPGDAEELSWHLEGLADVEEKFRKLLPAVRRQGRRSLRARR